MAIRLRQLEAFRAVSRHGSVTRAAEYLNISQPAVSRLLGSFADTVGFTLFERRSGQLIPTQESRYLLGEVGRLLDSLDHLEELTMDLGARKAGHLRLACLPGFATVHLPSVLAGFLKTRPGVTVTVEPDRAERILEWIIGEQYDFGITDGFIGHPAVESQTLQMRTVCILPDGHHLAAAKEIWPEDLAQEKLIHTRRGSPFFRRIDSCFTERGVTMPSWIEFRQFSAACKIVAEGVGVSIVSEMDARQHLGGGLVLKTFGPTLAHDLTLLHPINTPLSMITLEFMETFIESLAPYQIAD